MNPYAPRTRWTDDEVKKLLELVELNYKYSEMSEILGKQPQYIRKKCWLLRNKQSEQEQSEKGQAEKEQPQ